MIQRHYYGGVIASIANRVCRWFVDACEEYALPLPRAERRLHEASLQTAGLRGKAGSCSYPWMVAVDGGLWKSSILRK
jgi:hypothetical protein